MKLCTALQIREFDKQTILDGTPGTVLMERAGQHLCDVCVQMLGDVTGKEIIIVCGGGNNGGDGFVVARLLHELQAQVKVLLLVAPEKIRGDARVNFDLLSGISVVEIYDEQEARSVSLDCDLVIDSLLGTGLTRDVSGRFLEIIQNINSFGELVLAVDIPSGLDADSGQVLGCAVKAHTTVTFQLQKVGMAQYPALDFVGKVIVVDIGISQELIAGYLLPAWLTKESVQHLLPKRMVVGHKGTFGHVLILAGSVGKTGAAVLSGLGCLRSGAGLVSLCVPEKLNPIFETNLIEAMTIPVRGNAGLCFHNRDFGAVMDGLKGKGSLVLGPGLGMESCTGQLVNQLVAVANVPIIIDADGLNLLDLPTLKSKTAKNIILTPHPGEMARLAGKTVQDIQKQRVATASLFAREFGVVVVLKGAATVIAGPSGEVAINSTGNAGMGAGGMGDVLSGIIGTFLAQGLSCFDAACLGVFSHGRAGDVLVQSGMPFGYLASELADALPDVWQEMTEPTKAESK